MFNRAVLLVVVSLAVSLLVMLPGRATASVAKASGLELAVHAATATDLSVLHQMVAQHRATATIYTDLEDDCCLTGLVNPFLSCAPDCGVMPVQVPAPSRDLSRALSMPADPPPVGPYSSGIYRPPISRS